MMHLCSIEYSGRSREARQWPRLIVLYAMAIGLGGAIPEIASGQTPPPKQELVLKATVIYTGASRWSQPGQVYDESVTVTASGTTRWPMAVDLSGYLVESGPPTKDYTISVQGNGRSEWAELGTSSWSFLKADGWQDKNYFMNVNFFPKGGYAEFEGGSFPPIAVQGVDLGGGAIDRGGWAYEVLQTAWGNWNRETDGRMTFATNAPTISASGQGTSHAVIDVTGPGVVPVKAQGSMQATFSVSVGEPEFEVVIIPPEDFDQWLPQAGKDEKTPGNGLMVRAEIRAKGQTNSPAGEGTFEIDLLDTSREPGICLNVPAQDQATSDYDLQINPHAEIQVSDDGQSGQTTNQANYCLIQLNSYDYGAFARLRVQATVKGNKYMAHVDGKSDQFYLTIPADENDNHIADAWEKQMGVFDRHLAEDWDEVDFPKNHKCAGDGIGLYERYRGFQFQGLYERLSPTNKYVFVSDPDEMVWMLTQDRYAQASSFPSVSQCRLRFVNEDEWTGPGKAGENKRIVNFNSSGFGHAVDQHALQVQFEFEETPVVPPDWDAMWKTSSGGSSWSATGSLDNVLGMTWPDYTTDGFSSPRNTFLITIYPPVFVNSIRSSVIYHTWGLPEYANYWTLSPADQHQMDLDVAAAADRYIRANYDGTWQERYRKKLAATTTHEMGHGLGINHHDPTSAGSKECVLRYFKTDDFPRDPTDRFELKARSPWPDLYCRSADHTANGRGCWFQITVTDK